MTTHKDIVKIALEYPIDHVIQRYAEDQELSIEAAREHAFELKRYLALCALSPQKPYAMRGPIDEFWHTFVTFTKLYTEFCEDVAGSYIHHLPNTSPRIQKNYTLNRGAQPLKNVDDRPDDVRQFYIQMLEDYEATFQMIPPVHLWPRPGLIGEDPTDVEGAVCGVCRCGCRCIA